MSKPESRKRSKNFDNLEREVLLEAAIENKEIIDSKFTNQITNVKKNKVWREVQMKVNALGVASRSVPEVKNKWNNMIQKAKKENTEFVTKAKATGGGPPPTPLSPISSRIVDIYGDSPAFSGLMGVQSSFADEEMVTILPSVDYTLSPNSTRFIDSVVSTQMTPGGDASCSIDLIPEITSPENLSSKVPVEPAVKDSSDFQSTNNSSSKVPIETSNSSQAQSTSSSGKIKPMKKRKITPDDVTQAQYEVLQLQKQKLQEQTKYYQLMNKKLQKELEQ